jgi:hypothetical protein
MMSSLYQLDQTLAVNNTGECFYVNRQYTVQKRIWKMSVPNVMEVFMLMACKNALPTKANFVKRKVVEDLLYPFCEADEETTGYILWKCTMAEDTWSMCGSRLQKSNVENGEFTHIMEELKDKLDDEEFALLAVVGRNL